MRHVAPVGALMVAPIVALAACSSAPAERTAVSASGAPADVEPTTAAAAATHRGGAAAPALSPAAPTPPPPPPAPPPRIDGPAFVEIPVDGHEPAVVAVPVGAPSPQPVVLATHGNYDTPDWQCSTWREILGPERFVLCPRGISRPDSPSRDDVRFTYATNAALEVEIDAALAALRARFGEHVGEGPIVYTGFSLGAIMGVAIAARAKHVGRYEAMVLVEGGHDRWTPTTARSFVGAGGRRVLFGCGQASCFLDARRAAAHLERAGAATRIVGVRDAGHSYGGAVSRAIQAAWPFVDGIGVDAAEVAP